MSVVEISQIKNNLLTGQRLLCLDIGSKTIGLALSDISITIATPMTTIWRKKFSQDVQQLKKLIEQEKIGGLILGLPIKMDGTKGPRCQSVYDFARNIEEHIDIPIAFWDERLSTVAVERILIKEADMSRRKRSQVVDKMAAAYILQSALDSTAKFTK
ncbi:MAG: Holliday junction resolvase RuvX [Pseudomonadota bacterium]|nr:Holliday junction resolvase RuvX [Pseudomonadota bacterium]